MMLVAHVKLLHKQIHPVTRALVQTAVSRFYTFSSPAPLLNSNPRKKMHFYLLKWKEKDLLMFFINVKWFINQLN